MPNYYPDRIALQHDFPQYIKSGKNEKTFIDYCLGEYRFFQIDESNYGYHRENRDLEVTGQIYREYLLMEYNLWKKWQQDGRIIFDLSKDAAHDIESMGNDPHLNISLLNLPFSSFYVDISNAGIFFDPESKVPVEGFYIERSQPGHPDPEMTWEYVYNFNFTGEYIENFGHFNSLLMADCRGFHSCCLFYDPVAGVYDLSQAIDDAKACFINEMATEDTDTKLDLYLLHTGFIHRAVRPAINTLMYIIQKNISCSGPGTNLYEFKNAQIISV